MKKVTLYKWENIQAVAGWQVRHGFSFENIGNYGFINCDDGQEYILPEGYTVAENVGSEMMIWDEKNRSCVITCGSGGFPVLSSGSGRIVYLRKEKQIQG